MEIQNEDTFITVNRKVIIYTKDLLFLKGELNYTTLFMANGNKIIVAYTLKKFQDSLPKQDFVRLNKSILSNTSFVKSHSMLEVVLANEDIIKIARRRKEDVFRKLPNI